MVESCILQKAKDLYRKNAFLTSSQYKTIFEAKHSCKEGPNGFHLCNKGGLFFIVNALLMRESFATGWSLYLSVESSELVFILNTHFLLMVDLSESRGINSHVSAFYRDSTSSAIVCCRLVVASR